MTYRVEIETSDTIRLISDTRSARWERVWRWITWTTEATIEEARAAARAVLDGRSQYQRGLRIIETDGYDGTTVAVAVNEFHSRGLW